MPINGVGGIPASLISMSKPLEKQKAVELRRAGLSYREILRQVPVAKATLSLWLRTVGLSRPQRQRLTEKRLAAARRGWEKLRRERLERIARTMAEAEAEARERLEASEWMWMLGTALYWAEGFKPKPWSVKTRVGLANMDPCMILIARNWLERYCSVDDLDVCYALYIHERADIDGAQEFWAARLGVSRERVRIRLKRHNPVTKRKNVGRSYYGTMQITVRRSTLMSHRIAGWTQGLIRYCGVG